LAGRRPNSRHELRQVAQYVAFRYHGRLQSIHHVDEYTIAQDMSPFVPGAPETSDWDPHFLMTLGPAIRPDHEVPTMPG